MAALGERSVSRGEKGNGAMAMRFLSLIGLSGAMLLAAGSGQAQEQIRLEKTGDLLRLCAPAPGPDARAAMSACEGFIVGTGLLYVELVRAKAIRPWTCAKELPTLAEARGAFVTWARTNPAAMSEDVIDGFWRAMGKAYPCT